MSKKFDKKPLAFALGTIVAGSLAVTTTANADADPFGMSDLSTGYMQVAEGEAKKEGSCGEGKCGANKMKARELPCGAIGEEGKCGEGKCAVNKK